MQYPNGYEVVSEEDVSDDAGTDPEEEATQVADSNNEKTSGSASNFTLGPIYILPPELIAHILTFITNPRELAVCMAVCRQWQSLLETHLKSYVARTFPRRLQAQSSVLSMYHQARQLYRAPIPILSFGEGFIHRPPSKYMPEQPLSPEDIVIFVAAKEQDLAKLIKALRAAAPKGDITSYANDDQLKSTVDLYPLFTVWDYNNYSPLHYLRDNQLILDELFKLANCFYKNNEGKVNFKKLDGGLGILFWATLFNQINFFSGYVENETLNTKIENAIIFQRTAKKASELTPDDWSDLREGNRFGLLLLMWAATYGYVDLLRLLHQSKGARVGIDPQDLITAFIQSGSSDRFNEVFDWQSNTMTASRVRSSFGTYLIDAVFLNRPKLYDCLLCLQCTHTALLNQPLIHPTALVIERAETTTTLLHKMVLYRREKMIEDVLEKSKIVDVNAKDCGNVTPLGVAVQIIQPNRVGRRIIHLLLKAGAKVLLMDGESYSLNSPFFLAHDVRSLKLLISQLRKECTTKGFQFYLAERLVQAVKLVQLDVVKFILHYQQSHAMLQLDRSCRDKCLNELHSSFMREGRIELEDLIYPLQRIKVLLWEQFSNKESGDAYASREELDVIYSGFKKQHGSSTVVSQRWRNVEESSRGEDDSEEGQSTEPRTGPGAGV